MKVRRKSEIAEAVQGSDGYWLITENGCKNLPVSPDYFAAHYEPVPEPPARDELTELRRALKNIRGLCAVWSGKPASELMSVLADINWECIRSLNMENELQCATPSVSEEQPAPIQAQSKTDYKRLKALGANVTHPAPHRATIAVIPCILHLRKLCHRNRWRTRA